MKRRNWKSIDYSRMPWLYMSYLFGGIQGIIYCLYFLVFSTYGVLWIPFEIVTVVCYTVGIFMVVTGRVRFTEVLYQRPRFEKITDFLIFMYGVIYLIMRRNLDSFGDLTSDVFCLGNIVLFGCCFIGRVMTELVNRED